MRRRTIAGLVASIAAIAVVVGASVVWPGLDAQETPDVDGSVWALQTGDGRRYARVNTTVGELDTVRSISNPDKVVESGDAVYLFSDSLSKVTRIDEALPTDLDDEALRASASTPAGTTDVVTAGDFVVYRTDSGAIFAGLLSGGSATQLDPFPSSDENAPDYTADAIAVDDRGILFSYSRADGSVLRYDIQDSSVQGRDPLDVEGLSAPLISAAGDIWAVVDADDGDLWLRGADAVAGRTDHRRRRRRRTGRRGIGRLHRRRDVSGQRRGRRDAVRPRCWAGAARCSARLRSRSSTTATSSRRGSRRAPAAVCCGARRSRTDCRSTTAARRSATSAGPPSSRAMGPSSSTRRVRAGRGRCRTGRSSRRARTGRWMTARIPNRCPARSS